MTRTVGRTILLVALLVAVTAGATQSKPAPSFQVVHVYVDTGDAPLAAWQLDLDVTGATIVGIEGGATPFEQPPYYDAAAMMTNRVIIADFSTRPADALPSGRVRVASIHVRVDDAEMPRWDATLVVAATPDADPIPATVILETGTAES